MRPLLQAGWVAIDFETTGSVEGWVDQPWQIGVARFETGRCVDPWEHYLGVAKERPFNAYAPGRHAQMRERLATEPELAACWPLWRRRVQGHILVAHNAATEKRVLRDAVPMAGFGPWVDTLQLSRVAWPGLESYALDRLIDRLDLAEEVATAVSDRAAHDALYDAVACGVLLATVLRQPGWEALTVEQAQRCRS